MLTVQPMELTFIEGNTSCVDSQQILQPCEEQGLYEAYCRGVPVEVLTHLYNCSEAILYEIIERLQNV